MVSTTWTRDHSWASPSNSWRGQTRRFALLALMIVAGAIFKGPEFFLQMGEDQGIFNYGGLLLLHGGQLYRDFWETKPPAEYLLHGVVIGALDHPWDKLWIGQAYTTRGQLALNVVDFLWSVATALAVYAVGRRWLRIEFAWVAALLAILHTNAVMLSQEGSIAEKNLLLPSTLAILAFQRYEATSRRWLLIAAGASAGLAILFKQPAATTGAVLGIWVLCGRFAGDAWSKRFSGAALLLAGCLLAFAPVAVWLLANDLVNDFWQQVVLFNLNQAVSHPRDVITSIADRTSRILSESSGLLWLAAAVGAALVFRNQRGTPQPTFWVAWAAASMFAIFWGGAKLSQPYYQYVVPSFALLGGYAAQRTWSMGLDWPALNRMAMRGALVAGCLVLFVFTSSFQRRVTLRIWHERWPVTNTTSTVERLDSLLPQGGSMYIWGGETELYLFSGAKPPTRHTHAFFLSKVHSTDPSYLGRRAELMQDLERHPPDVILIDPRTGRMDPDGSLALNIDTFPELKQLIAQTYVPSYEYEGWRGFRHRPAV